MDQKEFNKEFRGRTKKLALQVITVLSKLKYTDAVSVMRKQAIKSGTSVAANFRAVCRARSENERYAKLCIVVEEADETVFWLEMFLEAELLTILEVRPLIDEANEVLKVMSGFKHHIESSRK